MSSRHRRKGGKKFIMLESYVLKSAAWKALSPNDTALYLLLKWRYDGVNNGRIGLSVRQAADALHIGKNAAASAFRSLERKGFIAVVKKGAFSVKFKAASEWLLTEYKCDRTNELARRDFMRWRPPEKITVPSQVHSVPPQRPRAVGEARNAA